MKPTQTYSRNRRKGFSLVEVLIAVSIAVVIGAMAASFTFMSSKSALSITNQSEMNASSGNLSSLLVQRVRTARLSTVSADGTTLTLTYDDYGYSDTDGDGNFFNDSNSIEVFQYIDTDGKPDTTDDNSIVYRNTGYRSFSKTVLENVKPIDNTPIFSVNASNSRQIDISFETSKTVSNGQRQRVEIQTSAFRLN